MTELLIEAKNMTKTYGGIPAVDDVSFTVGRGEIVGFVGLNGAGKSTTINMLLGFIRPSAGELALFGNRVTLPNAARSHRRIGFATGDMTMFDDMTGRQYLRFVARSHAMNLRTAVYKKLVQRFEPQLDKKLAELSRGNKQKIALIAAFMTEPDLVILDEPSSGLDPLMQQHFLELVREASEKGTTVFMSSHYLNEVVDVCSRILLIKNGQLVKDIPASDLEKSAGKRVRVIASVKVAPPLHADMVEHETQPDGHVLQFVYHGDAKALQHWIAALPSLSDITIADDSTQVAFEDLYGEEAGNV